MLFNSATVVLSFANKVVKVQPRKFIRSLYGVPRTLHLVLEVGFANNAREIGSVRGAFFQAIIFSPFEWDLRVRWTTGFDSQLSSESVWLNLVFSYDASWILAPDWDSWKTLSSF